MVHGWKMAHMVSSALVPWQSFWNICLDHHHLLWACVFSCSRSQLQHQCLPPHPHLLTLQELAIHILYPILKPVFSGDHIWEVSPHHCAGLLLSCYMSVNSYMVYVIADVFSHFTEWMPSWPSWLPCSIMLGCNQQSKEGSPCPHLCFACLLSHWACGACFQY